MKEEGYIIGIFVCVILIIGALGVYFGWITFINTPEEPKCPTGQTKCDDGVCRISCVIPPTDKLATNLVFNAPLSTDATDKVSGRVGTLTNVVFENGYAKFSGGTSNIKYPYDSNTINSNTLGMSVCVRLDDPTKHSYFVSKYHSYTLQNYAFSNATKQFHRFDGLIYKNLTYWAGAGRLAAVSGKWYHVVMNYNGTTENLFIDKVLNDKNNQGYPIPNDVAYGIMIGNRADNLQRGLVGAIKHARIYSKPLTTEQIELAYNECSN